MGKDVTSKHLFCEFDQKPENLQEYIDFINKYDDWDRYGVNRTYQSCNVPHEILHNSKKLHYMSQTYGGQQAFIMRIPPNTSFNVHSDTVRPVGLNFSLSDRGNAFTIFEHPTAHERRGHTNIFSPNYGNDNQYVLLNTMMRHSIVNLNDHPIYTFTLTLLLKNTTDVNEIAEVDDIGEFFPSVNDLDEYSKYRYTIPHLRTVVFNNLKNKLINDKYLNFRPRSSAG